MVEQKHIQRDRDVAEIDAIIAKIDHGQHTAAILPAPDARKRILKRGEGPVYSFKEVASRAFMERRRAGDSAAKVFIDDKPFTPSSHELWKVGAEKDEIRRWIGEGNKMAKKKAAKKTGAKGASKNTVKSKSRDSRLPKTGTTITGKYHGKEYTAKVLADGVEYKGKVYGSVSKVGSIIMGGKACNGFVFFGLNDKPKKAPPKKKAKK